jgi:hypothetical protein
MVIEHALDVTTGAGEIIIDADDISALLEYSQRWESRNPAPPVTSTRVSRCNIILQVIEQPQCSVSLHCRPFNNATGLDL